MIYIYVDTLKANNKQFGMSLRVGSFQGALRFRPSFIVTGSFLTAFHPPHASLCKLTSSPYWLK